MRWISQSALVLLALSLLTAQPTRASLLTEAQRDRIRLQVEEDFDLKLAINRFQLTQLKTTIPRAYDPTIAAVTDFFLPMFTPYTIDSTPSISPLSAVPASLFTGLLFDGLVVGICAVFSLDDANRFMWMSGGSVLFMHLVESALGAHTATKITEANRSLHETRLKETLEFLDHPDDKKREALETAIQMEEEPLRRQAAEEEATRRRLAVEAEQKKAEMARLYAIEVAKLRDLPVFRNVIVFKSNLAKTVDRDEPAEILGFESDGGSYRHAYALVRINRTGQRLRVPSWDVGLLADLEVTRAKFAKRIGRTIYANDVSARLLSNPLKNYVASRNEPFKLVDIVWARPEETYLVRKAASWESPYRFPLVPARAKLLVQRKGKTYWTLQDVSYDEADKRPKLSTEWSMTDLILKYLKYGRYYARLIVEGTVETGMPPEVFRLIRGEPDDINYSGGNYGSHEQWIYGDRDYYYFDDGKLTSWQHY